MRSNILLYFVKYPTPGKVKTRLARTVGDGEAAKLYTELVEKNLKVIAPFSQQKRYNLMIVFDPPEREKDFRKWFSLPCEYLPQRGRGLSERLTYAFREAFSSKGSQRVMALGSDTLGLTSDLIEEGFEVLVSKDVVIGPAQDGGYYLIGLSREQPALFRNIPWSTSRVLESTLKIIQRGKLKYHLLKELEDLDEINKISENIGGERV